MNRTGLTLFFLASLLVAARAAPATAPRDSIMDPVGTKELIEHPRDYDGKEILFEGEAIGDPMGRGGFAWVNILDSNAAMGVFMPAALLPASGNYGSYAAAGDRVLVCGVFHRACPDHGGDMDVHASSVTVLAAGHPTAHHVSRLELALVLPAFLLATALFAVLRKREARSGNSGKWLS